MKKGGSDFRVPLPDWGSRFAVCSVAPERQPRRNRDASGRLSVFGRAVAIARLKFLHGTRALDVRHDNGASANFG
jgi:hypothetical protein